MTAVTLGSKLTRTLTLCSELWSRGSERLADSAPPQGRGDAQSGTSLAKMLAEGGRARVEWRDGGTGENAWGDLRSAWVRGRAPKRIRGKRPATTRRTRRSASLQGAR